MKTITNRRISPHFVRAILALAIMISSASAAAISLKTVDLAGSTLAIEGSKAIANAVILVDGQAAGNADKRGRFRFSIKGYSSADCVAQISDGGNSISQPIANCTPAPTPTPNLAPVASAGGNITLPDNDNSGSEPVTLNGAASSDPDGNIVSWLWTENGVQIASGEVASAVFTVGVHPVELTVTDNLGAISVDTLVVTIQAATLPPPPSLPPLQPDAILESNQTYSGSFDPALMGLSVASAGDVNGDGYDDVIVGAKGWDSPGGFFDEGAAFVFLGSANGISGFDPATAQAVIQSSEGSAEFGTSVAGAGDVNGDGYDDIIVGAPLASPSGLSVSGAAYIFHGGPLGISATSPADANAMIESKQIEAHLGQSVASAGDVNGDGYSDVIVGANLYGEPFNPPIPNQGSGRQGAAFVFLGSATGIVGNQPANAHAQIVPWANGTPAQTSAGFGMTVASAGDVNADGYDDIMIGSPFWNKTRTWPGLDTGNPPEEGAVFLYYGSAAGITGSNPTNADARLEGNQLEALFGSAIDSAGDINGDGYGDIIIGAVGYPAGDPLLGSQEGAAFIYLGGPGGIVANDPAQADAAIRGNLLAEWMGRRVAGIGDYDGDGFDDVVISARLFPGSLTNEGVSYLFRGSASGLVGASADQAYARINSGITNASLGYGASGAGDVNADGNADFILGVTGYSNGQAKEGAAFVYLGAASTTPVNRAPVANAGQSITLVDSDNNGSETVTLDGSASFDADGSIASYQWLQGATQLGAAAVIQTVLPLGDHLITLTVTDNNGASASDTILVSVTAAPVNTPPVANAGADQSVTDANADGVAAVTLDGSASTDSDGLIVSYAWSEGGVSLGAGAILNTSLPVGAHTITLLVTDNNGATAQDSTIVTVNPGNPPADPQGSLLLSSTTQAARGDQISFSVTLINTGAVSIPLPQFMLSMSDSNIVKGLNPGNVINATDIPVGGSATYTWTAQADKQGSSTVSVEATSNGIVIDTASMIVSVSK